MLCFICKVSVIIAPGPVRRWLYKLPKILALVGVEDSLTALLVFIWWKSSAGLLVLDVAHQIFSISSEATTDSRDFLPILVSVRLLTIEAGSYTTYCSRSGIAAFTQSESFFLDLVAGVTMLLFVVKVAKLVYKETYASRFARDTAVLLCIDCTCVLNVPSCVLPTTCSRLNCVQEQRS